MFDLADLLLVDILTGLDEAERRELSECVESTFLANIFLSNSGLAPLTWGNVSSQTKDGRFMVIKPSGVSYEEMVAGDMVIIEIESGRIVSTNKLNPSTDTPTHLYLYKRYPRLRGIAHTHSSYATAFAQAEREISCFGTTHADNSVGSILLTAPLNFSETESDYELNTAKKIEERLREAERDVTQTPGILVREHGVFSWSSKGARASVEAAIAIEEIAKLALFTLQINPTKVLINPALAKKHFARKHGPDAYYGQRSDEGKEG